MIGTLMCFLWGHLPVTVSHVKMDPPRVTQHTRHCRRCSAKLCWPGSVNDPRGWLR